jgi:PAS domain S-box-containing protein
MSEQELTDLRRQAEKQLARRQGQITGLGRTDLESLAHELAVHQIELEIQNEELRRSRAEAEEARDRYLDLFDFAPVGYFMLDEHNRIIEANLAGCRLLKTDRSNLLKTSFTKFIGAQDSEKFYLQRRKVLESGATRTGELQMQKADGTHFYAQIESLKVGQEGLRLAVMDVTERRQAEELLAQQKTQLQEAYKAMEAFSYSVSHDLKAPLRTLNGFSQAILEDYGDKLDAKGKEHLTYIKEAAQLMARLIDDLLNLSHISQVEINLDKVNLSELAKSVADGIKATQPERSAEFIIAPQLVVDGDRDLLLILLTNLLENSWKFSSKCAQSRIEVGRNMKDGKPVYFVKDNGAGFDMKYADKLFSPFRRLHTREEFPGDGIGLALSQRIIRRHGGRIWAKSEIGKGATFYFTLDSTGT